MPKRPKRPRDPIQLAKLIGDIAIGEVPNDSPRPESPQTEARRKGGVRGGRSRPKALSRRKRQAIARKAANARWTKKRS